VSSLSSNQSEAQLIDQSKRVGGVAHLRLEASEASTQTGALWAYAAQGAEICETGKARRHHIRASLASMTEQYLRNV
jgi:hypothetical protein